MPKFTKNIICPRCGREYLPAEIFLPNALLGRPTNIIRNAEGKILGSEGSLPDMQESYHCDNCSCPMEITATMSFSVTAPTMDDSYSLSTVSVGLFLPED